MLEKWIDIGKNPYSFKVQENEQGLRRVENAIGWKNETQETTGFMFCRVIKKEDQLLAIKSLSNPSIYKSFNNKIAQAYLVWKCPFGKKTPFSKETIEKVEKSTNADWINFREKTIISLSENSIKAWAENKGWDYHLMKWDAFINYPNATFNRGMQVGMANQIEKRKEIWYEFGLVSNLDSSLWRVNSVQRKIHSLYFYDEDIAPRVNSQKDWFLDVGVDFKNTTATKSFTGLDKIEKFDNTLSGVNNEICRLLWCTKRSLEIYKNKNLNIWFDWFSSEGKGAIVFDEKDTPEQKYLIKALESKGTLYQFWTIKEKDTQKEKGYIIWINIFPSKNTNKEMYWSTFTGESPVYKDKIVIQETDAFGRVKYRSLSKNGEPLGMAPQRLEENMYQSLKELKKQYKDIDKWVAKGLNVDKDTLKDRLSAEQVDAVALGKKALDTNSGLIIADETGFGKGRILAALALTSLKQNKTVILFTENKQLFSDFYRDLMAVNGNETIIPTLLHKTATIFDTSGELVTKSLTPKKFNENLNRTKWDKGEAKLIISTYSQINRLEDKDKDKKKAPKKSKDEVSENKKPEKEKASKIDWLLSRLGDNGVLLLDEAHNASGDSNVSNNLKKLIKKSQGVIFSSATYAKTENNLSLYEKALPLEDAAYSMLKKSLLNDTGDLREALTTAMALEGRFIRREHPPVPPPQPIWLEMDLVKEDALRLFSAMWQKIFEASEAWEIAKGGKAVVAWSKLGSALSRSIREFNIQLKLNDLADEIEKIVKVKNEKAVIVLESTFEAALREAINNEIDTEISGEDDDEHGDDEIIKKEEDVPLKTLPLWRSRWKLLIDKIAPQEEMIEGPISPLSKINIAKEKYREALKAMDQLPDWDLSPLDRIKQNLKEKGIDSGELSGRNLSLVQKEDGLWYTTQRETLERIELVRNFNSGKLDVIFVTRAGCSGISLHAGKTFLDQRVRNLIEWDIAVNAANRVQFWGRVRRKDQVIEPNFFGLALNTLAEKRTLAREDKKREKLAAHVGMKQEKRELSWLTPEGEEIVAEWASERTEIAKRIGVARPVNDDPIGRVDRALIRSIILPEEEQDALLQRLERGLDIFKDVAWKEKQDPVDRLSRVVKKEWFWGDYRATEDNPNGVNGSLNMPRINIVERVWEPKQKTDVTLLQNCFSKIKKDSQYADYQGLVVLKQWMEVWKKETHMFPELLAQRSRFSKWLKQVMPLMKTGYAVKMSKPGTEERTFAVILKVDGPMDKSENLKGASYWSLSQVGLLVWIVGDNEPTMIPFSRLFKDKEFVVDTKTANINWFKSEPVPEVGVSIEGNQVISAAWGKRWNIGRPMLIKDTDKGLKWIWALPRNWNWSVMKQIPRDLVDTEHAIDFLKQHHNQELIAALPVGMEIKMMVVQGGIRFHFNKKAYDEALETWLAFKQNRAMSWAKTINGSIIERSVPWSDLRTVLYAMEAYGVIWRCSPEFLNWYRTTSVERIELFDKTKNTEKKKNPNKKKFK